MDGTKFNRRFLKMLLKMQCEKETLDCVIHEMRAVLGEKMPEEDAVRAYLKDPGKKTTLTVGQQVLAMDKLLEDAEVNFHMICDKRGWSTLWMSSCSSFVQAEHKTSKGGAQA